ncbi:hypothetical protein L3X07_04275 [Levilactobacillus brevis]|nr:hypothetical protein [Levilactobacillus brevis]
MKTGTAYKIDYARPLKGFSDKKIGPHHYRLTIKQLGRQHQNYTPIDDTYDTAKDLGLISRLTPNHIFLVLLTGVWIKRIM